MRRGITPSFWRDRRVFLTGHTGFKGSWLSLWLNELGSKVTGYALAPCTDPALFGALDLESQMGSTIADVCDRGALQAALAESDAEVVFHLAAQPLVRASYADPVKTYATNVLGTVHLLEAVRNQPSVRAVVIVTTDKCYENREWVWGYREVDRLGGHDPYSSSKACAELVTRAYTQSFFVPDKGSTQQVGIATARAGNVIGGGDWAADRLLPDTMRAFIKGQTVRLRYPNAVRPWQHVLDPLGGYLMLAECLYSEGENFQGPWNFGPTQESVASVQTVVAMAAKSWQDIVGKSANWACDSSIQLAEAILLMLDATKSQTHLGWRPVFDLPEAVRRVIASTHAWQTGQCLRDHCLTEINDYQRLMNA